MWCRSIIADRAYYEEIVDIIGEHCRDVRPANTFIVAQLVDPRMKVEIEVTHRKRTRPMPTVLITGASRGIGRALADQYESDAWTATDVPVA